MMTGFTQMAANFTDMSNSIGQLVQTSAASASAGSSSDQKPFQKPSAFTGKLGGADARRFLAAFSLYAQSQRATVNVGQTGGGWVREDGLWNRSALTFMQDDA
ncbi:hypothetical protein MPER_02330, partial [Moniliophthora perniciosa FA553]